MARRILISFFVLLLAVAFSTVTFAQEKKEMPKDTTTAMAKGEAAMGPLKSITCDPACGFMVRSHDEKELISMAESHSKHAHKKTLSEKDAKAMVKTEASMK